MTEEVVIVKSESRYDFEKMVNEKVRRRNVKDIKFCVNPKIKSSYGSSYSNGEQYYAMVIYEDRGE